jgi:DNA-directed RNA polymerase specialized sigma24 family protein
VPRNDETKEVAGDLQKIMKAVLLAQIGGMKQREQIQLLDRAGFGQKEIAGLLGTTANAISVRLAEIRRTVRGRKP